MRNVVLQGGHLTLKACFFCYRCKVQTKEKSVEFQMIPYVNTSLQPTDDDLLLYYWLQSITSMLSVTYNIIKWEYWMKWRISFSLITLPVHTRPPCACPHSSCWLTLLPASILPPDSSLLTFPNSPSPPFFVLQSPSVSIPASFTLTPVISTLYAGITLDDSTGQNLLTPLSLFL